MYTDTLRHKASLNTKALEIQKYLRNTTFLGLLTEQKEYYDHFWIDDVTGPDEFTCIVNNNYYTNVMAKNNLLWVEKAYYLLKDKDEVVFLRLTEKLEVEEKEVSEWKEAGEKMYLPYDAKHRINAQDDSFLRKARWNLTNTPKENFLLLLHYHPLTLYRYQVCKQADTVLPHLLLEDEEDMAP